MGEQNRSNRSTRHAAECRRLAKILIPALRECARRNGYALAVHGSLAYDIDLIACPWAKGAADAKVLAYALRDVAKAVAGSAQELDKEGAANPEYFENGSPGLKPFGRLCWTFHLGGGSTYIDLSVMPMQAEAAPA